MTEEIIMFNKSDVESIEEALKRLEQENENLKKEVKQIGSDFIKKGDYARELEKENKELKAYKDVNEDFKKAWDELNKKYTEVLKLAKTNADSNEYCLQELEQKYEQLRSALDTIQRMVLSAWEQGKYLDGGLYNDLINEFTKTNEVLNESKQN